MTEPGAGGWPDGWDRPIGASPDPRDVEDLERDYLQHTPPDDFPPDPSEYED